MVKNKTIIREISEKTFKKEKNAGKKWSLISDTAFGIWCLMEPPYTVIAEFIVDGEDHDRYFKAYGDEPQGLKSGAMFEKLEKLWQNS